MSASCSDPRDPDNPTGTGRFLSQLALVTGEEARTSAHLMVGGRAFDDSSVPIVNAKTFDERLRK
jgi:hypothetical protein